MTIDFFSFREFKEHYPNTRRTNFLIYNGIIMAILEYQQKCRIVLDPKCCLKETTVWKLIKEKGKSVQKTLTKSDVQPTAVLKWNDSFADLNWFEIFRKCYKCQDMQLRWFQMRVLHRILNTRKYLHECKIVDDPVCNFCQTEVQTIQHLLWSCSIVQKFWTELSLLISSNCQHCVHLTFSEVLVIFVNKEGLETDFGLNYILLLAKFYIYKAYLKDVIPNIQGFIGVLKQKLADLKYMHTVEDTLHCSMNNGYYINP